MVSPTAAAFFLHVFSEACCNLSRFPSTKWPRILLNLTWLCTKASHTFSGTFSGTLLNLTWRCTKDSRNLFRNLLRNFSGALLNLTWGTLLNLTWLCTKASQTFSGPLLNLTKLPRPSPEPSPETCWTWPGSAPTPPRPSTEPSTEPSPEPSPEPCWIWPGSAPSLPELLRNLLRNLLNLLDVTWLCTKACQTFSGTFSGTSLNLTWRLHQCTPELFWAEDPISLRCWGKIPALGYAGYAPRSFGSEGIYGEVDEAVQLMCHWRAWRWWSWATRHLKMRGNWHENWRRRVLSPMWMRRMQTLCRHADLIGSEAVQRWYGRTVSHGDGLRQECQRHLGIPWADLFCGPQFCINLQICSIYTAGLKVRMPIWWRQVDLDIHFRVPREKFGRHSNPIYLVLKPLNKSGTTF